MTITITLKRNEVKSLLFFLSVFILFVPCFAQNRINSPFVEISPYSVESYGSGSNTFLNFYQKYISPVKGGNQCPMYPSCSQYSKILFSSLSVHKAYIGTFERILQCGRELHFYKPIEIGGLTRWYDPPNINKINDISIPTNSDFSINKFPSKGNENGFANFLFKKGEYYRAITEYLRLQYESSDSTQYFNYLRKIGLCYYFGSDYSGFINFANINLVQLDSRPCIKNEILLLLGKSYFHQNHFRKAITTFHDIEIEGCKTYQNEALFMLSLSYAKIYYWIEAYAQINKIEPKSFRSGIAKNISKSFLDAKNLPNRKPWLAGSLSAIIPGLGYCYAHRPWTGLTSFIVNSIIIWSIRDAIHKKNYGIATATSFFGIGWYFGNISGSAKAAKKYNNYVRNKFIDDIIESVNIDENIVN